MLLWQEDSGNEWEYSLQEPDHTGITADGFLTFTLHDVK